MKQIVGMLLVMAIINMMPSKGYSMDIKDRLKKAKETHEPFYNARLHTLSNGMRVVVIPNHRAPIVKHMVMMDVGAADEPIGISGTAHFLEHLLFKGTEKQKPGEFSKLVKTFGGRDNAFTSWEYTGYFQVVPSEHLEKVMRMEADRMRNANPPHEHFLTERNVVIEERRQTLENKPGARLSEQMRHALFVNHPYGRPIIGWMHEIEALDWPAIKEFYDRWYSPSNAILAVVGDVDPDELFKKAEEIYGVIPAFDVPNREKMAVRPKRAHFDTEKVITMRDPLVKRRSFVRRRVIPAGHHEKWNALLDAFVLSLMSGSTTSRLYKSLVVEQKKAISAYISSSSMRDYGTFSYGGIPVDGASFDELEGLIKAEMDKAAKDGFTEEEFSRMVKRLRDSKLFALDSVDPGIDGFVGYMRLGLDTDLLEYGHGIAEQVTLEDVNKRAKETLKTDDKTWGEAVKGYLLPMEEQQNAQ